MVTEKALDRSALQIAVAQLVATAKTMGVGLAELTDTVRERYSGIAEQEG